MSIYEELGFRDRNDYLESLTEEYGASLDAILMLASALGPDEDFDGLLAELDALEMMDE